MSLIFSRISFFLHYFYQAELLNIRDKREKLKIETCNKPESSSQHEAVKGYIDTKLTRNTKSIQLFIIYSQSNLLLAVV